MRGPEAFYDQLFRSYGSFFRISCAVFWTNEMHECRKILSNFSSQNKGFLPSKITKQHSCDCNSYKVYLAKAKSGTSLFTKNNQI